MEKEDPIKSDDHTSHKPKNSTGTSFFSLLLFVLLLFFLGLGGLTAYFFVQYRGSVSELLISPLSSRFELPTKAVIGFLPYWLLAKASPSYATTITDLAYFSLTVNGDGTIQTHVNTREEEPGWTTIKKESVKERFLQAKKEGLTTSLVLFSSTDRDIRDLISNPSSSAATLLTQITPIMQEYQFTDLNLDLESVTTASESARAQYTEFVRLVKEGLSCQKLGTLTIEITVSSLFNSHISDAKEIARIADRVVIMTYDYHYPGSILSGPIAPLNGYPDERPNDVTTSVAKALEVIPKEKLILGIPLYGYEWETISSIPGSPVIPGTGQTASDRRVEELLASCTNCTQGYDEASQERYIVYPEGTVFNQIYYTDQTSMKRRLQFSDAHDLGGVALWALGYEGSDTMTPLTQYKRFRLFGQ